MPTNADRTMYMPEKNMPDVGIVVQYLLNSLRVFPQVNIIKDWDADFKWRMMHEKENRNIPGRTQLITEPFTAFIAV